MIFRACSKIVVASLVILGMDAIASENSQRTDESFEAARNSVQLPHPAIPDGAIFMSKIAVACTSTLWPCISLDDLIVTAVTVPALEPLKYRRFNPRAPPVPANSHT